MKITDGDLLQEIVTNVNNEWKSNINNVDITEWNNNVNEGNGGSLTPCTEEYEERLQFPNLGCGGMQVQEVQQGGEGGLSYSENERSLSSESFVNIMQDALYDFDFNEADVERLLE